MKKQIAKTVSTNVRTGILNEGLVKRTLIILGLVFGIGAWTSSASAAPNGWAYLFADQPLAASYTPAQQRNSSGASNTVMSAGGGEYVALLPNLGSTGGTVHVTAVGSWTQHCKVERWGPALSDPTTQAVAVRCFNNYGALSPSQFTLSYTKPVIPDGPMAFLWANQPSAASYAPALAYQFNSTGAVNTVSRSGVGLYTATLPNLGTAWTGHVQVTAYGRGSERCKVSNWSPGGSDVQVGVRCLTGGTVTLPGGFPVDAAFTLTYVEGNSLIGGGAGPSEVAAYVWANQPASASYTPHLNYQWNDFDETFPALGGPSTVTRIGAGHYEVHLDASNLFSSVHVQVTAYGTGSEHCKLTGWMTPTDVEVRCFDGWGHSADSRFTMAFIAKGWMP
jgi:hypothetical protein